MICDEIDYAVPDPPDLVTVQLEDIFTEETAEPAKTAEFVYAVFANTCGSAGAGIAPCMTSPCWLRSSPISS